jgi:hypothetical protein
MIDYICVLYVYIINHVLYITQSHQILFNHNNEILSLWQKACDGRPLHRNVSATCQWSTPVILATWEAEIRMRPTWANTSQDPISRRSRAKWTRDLAQAVEHLLC